MGNNPNPKTENPNQKKKLDNITYQEIERSICEGRRITQKQLREVLMGYFYEKAQRDSIVANYEQSDYLDYSKGQYKQPQKPYGLARNNQPYLPGNFSKHRISSDNHNNQQYSRIQNTIMQAQLDELDKKIQKPTSESSNILSSIDLSSIVEPAQDRKEPDYLAYKKFYAQLLEFFQDISKYKYEKDFTQEVDEICNKNIRHLVQKSQMPHQKQFQSFRNSTQQLKSQSESEIDLFKNIMGKFMRLIQNIDRKAQQQFKNIQQNSEKYHMEHIQKLKEQINSCEQQIFQLKGELEIQTQLCIGYKKKVEKDKIQKQFEHNQQIKQLHQIISYYKNMKSPQKPYNQLQIELPPESIINSRKISEDSALNRLSYVKSFIPNEQKDSLNEKKVEEFSNQSEFVNYEPSKQSHGFK